MTASLPAEPGHAEGAPGDGRRQPSFQEMWRELAPLGRDSGSGGYRRYAWTAADADCRAWFRAQAEARGWPTNSTATATSGPGSAIRSPGTPS